MEIKLKKLNLGCGEFKKAGYINLDRYQNLNPDIVHDLNRFPYPFSDSSFDLIEADHVLEHLDDPLSAMKELHRILKNNGRLLIKTPHFSRGFTHPDHKRGFDVTFPYYFRPSFKGGYAGVEFYLDKLKLRWFAQPYLKKAIFSRIAYWIGLLAGEIIDFFANLSPRLCTRIWCFWVGGFEEIEFYFISKK